MLTFGFTLLSHKKYITEQRYFVTKAELVLCNDLVLDVIFGLLRCSVQNQLEISHWLIHREFAPNLPLEPSLPITLSVSMRLSEQACLH